MEAGLMTKANNAFGWELFKIIAEGSRGTNVFLSPYSISVALAMTKLGARGETDRGMAQAMQWGEENPEKIHKQFQAYTKLIQKPCPHYQLSTANRIFIEQSFPVLEEFKNQTKGFYMAEAESVNFREQSEAERQKINTWVEGQTQEKIKDLLPPGVLNTDTRMVLVNAIYFKGKWQKQFKEQDTQNMPFKLAPGKTKNVPMMCTTEIFPYFQDKNLKCTALELPYEGRDLGMVIILPDEDFGLEALVAKLNPDRLTQLLKDVGNGSENIQLHLPKFEMTCNFELRDTLSTLGMTHAFCISANFSGMTDSGTSHLQLSNVIHKVFVKVNEEGTEAAAATAVVVKKKCRRLSPTNSVTSSFTLKKGLSDMGMKQAYTTVANFEGMCSDSKGLCLSNVIHKAYIKVNEEGTEAAAATAGVTSSFELKPSLCTLGMSPAFGMTNADFTGMTQTPELYLSEVYHKAYVKVNEEGTEAAAATGAVMMLRCAMPIPKPRVIIDHPFLFTIRDRRAEGNVLFFGQIADPEK